MAYTVTDIGPTTGVEISGLSGAELVDQASPMSLRMH